MKRMKRIASLIMALAMALTMAVPAMAAGDGSITINGVSEGNTYTIYKMLDLESYNTTSGAYSYKVNSAWSSFFTEGTGALSYMAVDEAGYVTWIAAEDDDTKAAFAKLAKDYADKNHIPNVGSLEATKDQEKMVFSGLELGYYLIDSTMGALCGLTTTNPSASINAKNGAPTIDKQVKEDSTSQWADSNTADIGQTVEFRTTISVHAGAQDYILHDRMSAGLTFNKESVTVEHVIPGTASVEELDLGVDYTVVTEGLGEGCTFEVRFSKEFCDSLETNDKIIVYYSAMLNRNAIVAGDGNPNTAQLEFGEDHFTTEDTTTTKTYGFDIVKTDSQNTLINGAEFRIYDAATGGNEVGVVLMDDGETYRRARPDEQEEGKTVNIVVKDGKVRVVGFDNGTYYLEEVVSPPGYNKLTERQKFIIGDGNLNATFNDGIYSTGSGVHVVNKTGSMLPETGGMGTTLFYLAGGLLVIGAGVALVTKKRMA